MQTSFRHQKIPSRSRFLDNIDCAHGCKTISPQSSQNSQFEGGWDSFGSRSTQETFGEGSQSSESSFPPIMHVKTVSVLSRDVGFGPVELTSGNSISLPWSLHVGQISPMDLNPELSNIIKQEPIENEPAEDFLPPYVVAMREQLGSWIHEEPTLRDDEKSSTSLSTEDEKSNEKPKSPLQKFSSAAGESVLAPPRTTKIRKVTKQTKFPKSNTLRSKPYTRNEFNSNIQSELIEQLDLLDSLEISNADVIKHMCEKFPLYAQHREFTTSWVTKARYGQILTAVTGRKPVRLRGSGLQRSRASKSEKKVEPLTDRLFLEIWGNMHEFSAVPAAARHYNVDRSCLKRRMDKARNPVYIQQLRMLVADQALAGVTEESEGVAKPVVQGVKDEAADVIQAEVDDAQEPNSLDEVLLLR